MGTNVHSASAPCQEESSVKLGNGEGGLYKVTDSSFFVVQYELNSTSDLGNYANGDLGQCGHNLAQLDVNGVPLIYASM
jgi:hypothetical protein